MPGTIFQGWFSLHFVPRVRQYCNRNNLEFKLLSVLDNAPGHPHSLEDLYPEIKVVFVPPNTSCNIQTLIATFKQYYMRQTINKAIRATDMEGGPTLKELWKGYNIRNAVNNIGDSWAEIKLSTMNGCWEQLCLELVTNFEGFEETPEAATKEVVRLMNQPDLEVSTEDMDELTVSHSEPMSNEDLIVMQEANKAPREDQDDDKITQSPPTKTLNVKNLNEAFTYLEKFLNIVEEFDPNAERSSVVHRDAERVTHM
jgi:hypothetical protein